jgi:hypothetical protein
LSNGKPACSRSRLFALESQWQASGRLAKSPRDKTSPARHTDGDMAEDVIPSIAQRYHVSLDAAREVERALRATGGRQAQFSHPELGGTGQWMPGMLMIHAGADRQLRARVEGLLDEVAAVIRGSETASPAALARDPNAPAASSRVDLPAGESWWPASYGHPTAHGCQSGIRYALFPGRRCVLVQVGSRIDCFDTADHKVRGVGQTSASSVEPQQGHASRLVLTTAAGEIPLDHLECIPIQGESPT